MIGFSRARAESAFAAVLSAWMQWRIRRRRLELVRTRRTRCRPSYSSNSLGWPASETCRWRCTWRRAQRSLSLLAGWEARGRFKRCWIGAACRDSEAIPRGSRPLDYLRALADSPRALVIHGNYLSGEELAFIGERRERMSLVFCPRTHAYFGHAPYPLERAVSAGARVALGTDSRASNPDLSLLEEMRFVARHVSRDFVQ